ncbi:hypothetical protein PINS_up009495 [Pythium insidiosum]|nr:hypothetical protein PINS_up009495 [Pythium insidiosum]
MNDGNAAEKKLVNPTHQRKESTQRATKNGKAPLKGNKVARRQTSVKVKCSSVTKTTTARRKSSRRSAAETDDDEDYEDDTGDNDDDSDYEEDSASVDEEDDDADMNDISDEDFEKPIKLPSRKRSPAKKPPQKATPKEKGKLKTSRRNARSIDETQSPRRLGTSEGANGQDPGNDSMEPSLDEDREDATEEEAYFGPTYRIEYAANARAKVRSSQ